MDTRDREVLQDLSDAIDEAKRWGRDIWVRPLDCGGFNGSDHSYRLAKLERAGLAEVKQRRAHMSRGSKVYTITQAGRDALAAAQ